MNEDIQQLARIFEDHYGLMVAVARRYAPAPDLTYDIIQQSFIAFVDFMGKHSWSTEHKVGTLLYAIVRNVAVSMWREEKRRQNTLACSIEELLIEPIDVDAVSREAEEQKEIVDALKFCLQKQSPKSRRLIERHYCDNRSMERIAVEENCSGNAVRLAFCRIRKKLRACIEKRMNR